jgi:hypothetical protein
MAHFQIRHIFSEVYVSQSNWLRANMRALYVGRMTSSSLLLEHAEETYAGQTALTSQF